MELQIQAATNGPHTQFTYKAICTHTSTFVCYIYVFKYIGHIERATPVVDPLSSSTEPTEALQQEIANAAPAVADAALDAIADDDLQLLFIHVSWQYACRHQSTD